MGDGERQEKLEPRGEVPAELTDETRSEPTDETQPADQAEPTDDAPDQAAGQQAPDHQDTDHQDTDETSGEHPRRSHPVLARVLRLTSIALVGIAGGWLGLLLAGGASVQIGPVQTLMSLRPSLTGQTLVTVPPLGSLQMNTNNGPLQLNVDVRQLNEDDVKKLVADPNSFANLPDQASGQLRHGVIAAAIRAALAVAVGSLLLGLIAFRRVWPMLGACGFSLLALGTAGAVAAVTWNPSSVLEPRYTGVLAEAPSLVGNVQSLVTKFGLYRTELATLVTNVTRLYDTTADLPVYQPDPDTVRVLDVSDIHDNPAAWNIMHSIVQQFGINLIIDSGDLTDHGSQAENELATQIAKFRIPYVFIRGNHDSDQTQAAVAKARNAVVLTGQQVTVDGLTIIGNGDPRFTPDQSVEVPGEQAVYQAGQQLADKARKETTEPDIAVVHDPVAALPLDGAVKLVLAGHLHRRVSWTLSGGTRVFVQGSTGGAGLRALQSNPPTPIEASVMYFDHPSGDLQAWDDITIGGLGATNAQIQRHLASDTAPVDGPVPDLSPSAACASPSPSPEPTSTTSTTSPTSTTGPATSPTPCATPTDSPSSR